MNILVSEFTDFFVAGKDTVSRLVNMAIYYTVNN